MKRSPACHHATVEFRVRMGFDSMGFGFSWRFRPGTPRPFCVPVLNQATIWGGDEGNHCYVSKLGHPPKKNTQTCDSILFENDEQNSHPHLPTQPKKKSPLNGRDVFVGQFFSSHSQPPGMENKKYMVFPKIGVPPK